MKRAPLTLFCLLASSAFAAPGAPTGLLTDLIAHPQRTVITSRRPAFDWIVDDPRCAAIQSACQILLASSFDELAQNHGDVWDSGRIPSGQSIHVVYAGPPLQPGRAYFWKVRTWDGAGQAGPYSTPEEFRTAPPGTAPEFADRMPLEKSEVAPARFLKKGPGDYFVDFGRAAFGTVKLALDSPEAATVEVRLGEVPLGSDGINSDPGGARRYRVMSLPVHAGPGNYEVAITPWERNTTGRAVRMPPDIGEVMPFRYCELVHLPGPISAAQVRQIAVHYHFHGHDAAFHSSDPALDAVWDLCRYSIQATSFAGVFLDGDRERIPYEADAYIAQLGDYCCNREYSLARYTEHYLLARATWPAEWQLHMPLVAWADYLYTGDPGLLASAYAELSAKTLVSLERPDGLIESPQARATPELLQTLHLDTRPVPPLAHLIPQEVLDLKHPNSPPLATLTDWPASENDGYEMLPVSVVTNAFHYAALRRLADIAGALGKNAEARSWSERAARVYRSFQAVFFNPATGLYVDGEGTRHSSLHANMYPLAFGLVPPERMNRVAAFVKSRGMACSVYGAQQLFEALYRAGLADYALSLFTAPGDRSWTHMIRDVGTTITLEAWDDRYKPNEDWNHAWGAAPANLIPRLLMGVEPTAPGFARFRVKPQLGSLSHAFLKQPTIRGPVLLDVTQGHGTWRTALTVPANATAELEVPGLDPGAVMEGGKPAAQSPGVKYLRREGDRIIFEVPSGTYVFSTVMP